MCFIFCILVLWQSSTCSLPFGNTASITGWLAGTFSNPSQQEAWLGDEGHLSSVGCDQQKKFSSMGKFMLGIIGFFFFSVSWASLIAQLVKNLSAMQETPVRFLGQKDPLEKG